MAAHSNRTRTAAVIALLITGILVIAASAVTWQVYETTSTPGPGTGLTPRTVINVDAGSTLLYFQNISTKPANTAYLQQKATFMPVKVVTPLPASSSVITGSTPSSGTGLTPVTTYAPGYSGKITAPVPLNKTKSQKFPVSQQKPAALKPLPTIKPVTSVVTLPTLPAKQVPSTIIVNETTRQVEQRIFYYTNIERANAGKPALKWDEQLAVIGRDDCVDMAARGFFNHINPDGETPSDRAIRHGYQVEKDFGTYVRVGVGENIAMLSYYPGSPDDVARFIVDAWMNSPGHRANIVDSEEQKFTVIGIGVAYDQATYTWYAAQEFF